MIQKSSPIRTAYLTNMEIHKGYNAGSDMTQLRKIIEEWDAITIQIYESFWY